MVRENGMIMMDENEYEYLKKTASKAETLNTAVVKLLKYFKGKSTEDVEVTRKEFLAIYNAALEDLFNKIDNNEDGDQEIYGHNITVHWHGIYCNCEDGATVSNTVIDGVEWCSKELDD